MNEKVYRLIVSKLPQGQKIIDNRGEEHELMLIVTTICSLITFKKIKKLEQYRNKLKGSFKPY